MAILLMSLHTLILMVLLRIEGKYLTMDTYCCIRDGKRHVLCRNPGGRPPRNCTGYQERLSGGEMSDVAYELNRLRDDVARGNVTNWPRAAEMNKLEVNFELTMIARSMDVLCSSDFSKHAHSSFFYPTVFTVLTSTAYNKSEYHPSPGQFIYEEIETFRANPGSPADLENFDVTTTKTPIIGALYGFMRWVGCHAHTRDIPESEEELAKREKDKLPLKDHYQILCVFGPSEGLRKSKGRSYTKGQPRTQCYWELEGQDPYFPHLCALSLGTEIALFPPLNFITYFIALLNLRLKVTQIREC